MTVFIRFAQLQTLRQILSVQRLALHKNMPWAWRAHEW